LRFAQWCNEDFAIQVDCWIVEQGQIFVSRKGTARLSGVSKTAIQKIVAETEVGN
jgi:hypothetical protein